MKIGAHTIRATSGTAFMNDLEERAEFHESAHQKMRTIASYITQSSLLYWELSSVQIMDYATSPLKMCSPFSSPKPGALLSKRILAWSQETGVPTSVRVYMDVKCFYLHMAPLVSRSGYFKNAFLESLDIELPDNFPGGSETLEMILLLIYESCQLHLDPLNVASLRCAAEFLEMTEDYMIGNLCERSDLYLNQVVLQNWDDTLIVLQTCQTLLPMAEELLIVSRCVESMAFMACMEILDPEHRREQPIISLQDLTVRPWNPEAVKEIVAKDLWIKDLIALPFDFFKRIIMSLRRQGMKEKYVSPIIILYANKWVLSEKTQKFWENMDEEIGAYTAKYKVSAILEGILELLPSREKASKVIPVPFYFTLLSRALALDLSYDIRVKLQDQLAPLLHLARAEDFLLPDIRCESVECSLEVKAMEKMIHIHWSSKNDYGYCQSTPSNSNSIVAELWDRYLTRIAMYPNLGLETFMKLIEACPMVDREIHDHLYGAISAFLSAHTHLTNEEKTAICKYLNCRKFSQETCIQAVQDEFMPIRLVVQALLVQQMHTHQAFKECSESFRYINCTDFSGSIQSTRSKLPNSQTVADGPYEAVLDGEPPGPSSGLLQEKGDINKRTDINIEDFASTSFRIQILEKELRSLKHNLHYKETLKSSVKKGSKSGSFRLFRMERKVIDSRRKPVGQMINCIGYLSWTSQRKYCNRLLEVLRRIVMFRRGKSKSKEPDSDLSFGTLACQRASLHELYDC